VLTLPGFRSGKSNAVYIGIGHPDIDLPAPTANIPPADDLDDVASILKKKYPKSSKVKVIERRQDLLRIEIDGRRGSVFSGVCKSISSS
jgi:hypothetical protein